MNKKSTHGGKRVGAGRKKGTKIIPAGQLRETWGTRLSPDIIRWLRSEADRRNIPCSTFLEMIINFFKDNYSGHV